MLAWDFADEGLLRGALCRIEREDYHGKLPENNGMAPAALYKAHEKAEFEEKINSSKL